MFYRNYSGGLECFTRGGITFSWVGLIGVVIFLAIAVTVVWMLVKQSKRSHVNLVDEKLEMLYVNGEITEEEFLRRKSIIAKK
ncbi:MAG: SHOCT domain-containing protein [Clostridia bacterium]|nr:SHOCT domain-containing protein [Clostridia bacterium]